MKSTNTLYACRKCSVVAAEERDECPNCSYSGRMKTVQTVNNEKERVKLPWHEEIELQ